MNCSAYASINSVIVSSHSYWILSIDNVLEESKTIFEDVLADCCDIRKILLKFQERKEKFPDSYCDAYIGFCLPKLLNPLVRVQLINWSPLEVCASPDFIFVKNCVCVFVCSDILWASVAISGISKYDRTGACCLQGRLLYRSFAVGYRGIPELEISVDN